MKITLTIVLLIIFISCKQKDNSILEMKLKIDSLENKLNEIYKPGLGEFMTGIQMHHAKLWFAGQNKNWPLADFEIHEILEAVDDIKKYCNDREETKTIGIIENPIKNLTDAIKQKDITLFKNNFILLTSSCNSCHKSTMHDFNVVTIPVSLPVVNQDFKPVQ